LSTKFLFAQDTLIGCSVPRRRNIVKKKLFCSGYIDWTQCSEEAKRMKKAGSLVHEAFLLRERERKRQANQRWNSWTSM
jgi:hypothetical protein